MKVKSILLNYRFRFPNSLWRTVSAVMVALSLFSVSLISLCQVQCKLDFSPRQLIDGEIDIFHESIVALYNDSFVCSGILIDRNIVVTAAHCILDTSLKYAGIKLKDTNEEIFFEVLYAMPHQDYLGALYNDIGILIIEKFTDAEPVFIDFSMAGSNLKKGDSVTLIGWGQTNDLAEQSVRRFGTGKIEELNEFGITISPDPSVACFGDSGGAVFVDSGGKEYLYGIIISADPGCQEKNTALSIFSYMDDFIDPFLEEFSSREIPVGQRCYQDSNCLSQHCLFDSDGLPICTRNCSSENDCPAGTTCKQGYGDSSTVCIPEDGIPGTIGGSCETNDDCRSHRCIRFPKDGDKICSTPCTVFNELQVCPDLFECTYADNASVVFACHNTYEINSSVYNDGCQLIPFQSNSVSIFELLLK
ncbi:MAG: S1 family peptidase [Deltaproteobacteria bacterium]|nr:S1 family peptidase [Deltaproteobacteria bacterium]